jgi:hypothetical protein
MSAGAPSKQESPAAVRVQAQLRLIDAFGFESDMESATHTRRHATGRCRANRARARAAEHPHGDPAPRPGFRQAVLAAADSAAT